MNDDTYKALLKDLQKLEKRIADAHIARVRGDAKEQAGLAALHAAAEVGGRADDYVVMQARNVAARGIAEAARSLSGVFNLAITNVPYLTQNRQTALLRTYAEASHRDAKNDLATLLLSRILDLLPVHGSCAVVLPINLFHLVRYDALRRRLLTEHCWSFLAPLGTGAFETITGEVVNVALFILSRSPPPLVHQFVGLDVAKEPGVPRKENALTSGGFRLVSQAEQTNNPDARVSLTAIPIGRRLDEYATCRLGVVSGDGSRWIREHWELGSLDERWRRLQGAPSETVDFAGRSNVIDWESRGEGMLRPGADNPSFGRVGVAVAQMTSLPCTLYNGHLYDNNVAAVVPTDASMVPAIWAYCSSTEYHDAVRQIDQKLGVIHGSLLKVPFDLPHWQKVAAEKYPNGLPEPYSEDPTQWLFKGTVTPSDAPLQVAVARLLGYRWPDQASDALDTLTDGDGIVCLPPVAGEVAAAERLRDLLRAAYGPAWSAGREQTLLGGVGHANRSLDDWLRNGFFEQHTKLFHQRPFLWQVWDGHKEGFSALVNYHRLDHKLLESLAFWYLGDWIKRQRSAETHGEAGATERLRRAEDLQRRLKLILDGEKPYDIFVRWKALAEQPVGWHPDINDGVRLNIRPFLKADVLRWTPNIKWGKDRGKNPPGAPWGEDRDNDVHLTLAEKSAAREK